METVLLQQFEEYLRTRGIRAERGDNEGNVATSKRKKRSVSSIADTLSNEEVEISFFIKPKEQTIIFNTRIGNQCYIVFIYL